MPIDWMVFPAHAGMSPSLLAGGNVEQGFPRTRGDEPMAVRGRCMLVPFSPHTRGWVLKNKAEFTALHFLSATYFRLAGDTGSAPKS